MNEDRRARGTDDSDGSEAIVVQGAPIDEATRCEHHASERDVVAFRFPCCGDWFPCRRCHDEASDHATRTWGPDESDERAVLCGVCRSRMRIDAYVACQHVCPGCGARFNPGCRQHWERYCAPEEQEAAEPGRASDEMEEAGGEGDRCGGASRAAGRLRHDEA